MNMNSKVVVVIGGTGGIGFSICKRLFEKGYTVYLLGRSKREAAKKTRIIDNKGELVFAEAVNVLQEEELEEFFKKVIKKHKSIHAVLNLAGIFEPFGEFEKLKLSEHKRVIEVNLFGSFNVVHKILPVFKKQNYGKIILFSGGGVGGDMPLVNASSYFTSKAAVSVFTEVLAKEVEGSGIQINAVLPGQILTKSTKKTFKISRKKLGSVLGPATENLLHTGGSPVIKVVDLVEFLISEKSNHITGRTLSAKWDNLKALSKSIREEHYKMRRIDGNIYKKVKG